MAASAIVPQAAPTGPPLLGRLAREPGPARPCEEAGERAAVQRLRLFEFDPESTGTGGGFAAARVRLHRMTAWAHDGSTST